MLYQLWCMATLLRALARQQFCRDHPVPTPCLHCIFNVLSAPLNSNHGVMNYLVQWVLNISFYFEHETAHIWVPFILCPVTVFTNWKGHAPPRIFLQPIGVRPVCKGLMVKHRAKMSRRDFKQVKLESEVSW